MSANETILNPAPVETPSLPVAPPQPAPAALPVTPAAPVERRDVIANALRNPSPRGQHAKLQPRSDQGQFAGPPAAPASTATPAIPAAPLRPAMPRSLKQDLKPHWETAPPELLTDFIRRDEDYEKAVRPLSQAKAQLDEILNEFKPYEMLLKSEGATPRTAIAPLLQTAAIFRTGTPAQKAGAAAQILRQFGIPLDHVQQILSGEGLPPQAALPQQTLDPQVQQLAQQVQQLTAFQQQDHERRAMAEISKFAADPAHAHFQAVADRMLVLLQTPALLGENADTLPEQEKLKRAYDMAVRLDPALSQQPAIPAAPNVVAAAKQAAVQVKGAPASAPAPQVNVKDRRALIRNAFSAQR